MKKLIIASCLLGVVAASQAQGIVTFANTGGFRTSTNSAVGGAATGLAGTTGGTSTTYYYALFVSPTSNAGAGVTDAGVIGTAGSYAFNSGSWTFSGDYATNNAVAGPGRLASSSLDAAGNTMLPNGFGGGTAMNYVIIGWSANIGSTVSALEAWYGAQGASVPTMGWIGESNMGTQTPGTEGATAATALFGSSSAGLVPGITMGEVVAAPEPATMALAAIGGASLLLFRRKK
jgi:hypothetical protein